MYVYVCVYIYVCVHIYICMYIYPYVCVCAYICIHLCICSSFSMCNSFRFIVNFSRKLKEFLYIYMYTYTYMCWHRSFWSRKLIEDLLSMPCSIKQDPVSPTTIPSHHEASPSLLSFSIRGQTEWKPQSQETNQTDPMITAFSNLMKLWTMLCKATSHGGEFRQNMALYRRKWQTTSVFFLENPMNNMKTKRYDTERWIPQVSRCPICYWRRAEK